MIKTNHKIKINNRNYYIFNENNRTYVKYEGNFVEIFILQNNINNKKGGGDDAKYAFTYQIRDINNAIEKYEKIFIKRQEKILYLCVNFINKIKSTESSINNKFAKMSISSDYDRSRYLTLINKEFYENLFKKYFIVIMQTINRDSIISEQSELKKIAKYLHFITYDDNEKDKKINNDFKEFEKIGVDDDIDEIVLKENVNNSLNELNNLITTFNADKKKIIDTESLKNNVMAIKNKISKWSAPSWQEILLSTFNEDVEYINDKSEKFKSNEKYLNAILNFLSMESSDINKFDEKSMDKIKKEVEKALETIKKIPNESNNDIDIPELINLIISNIKKLLINFINKNYSKNISSIQKLKDNSKKEIEEIIKSIENYKNVLDTSTTEEIAQVLKTGSGNINENSPDNSGSGNASSGNSGSGNSGSGNSGSGNSGSGNSGPGNASSGNAVTDKVDEKGGDKVDSSAGKTTITSDIPIYTEDEAEEIRKTRGAYKFWKEKGFDVDVSKIKMEISDDKTSITTWLDDPTSFDPTKFATLKGNDFYLNGNILKGQELLDYVNNIKKETLKIVTRKGQEEEKYNFSTNEIKGIASAPEYASTREKGSASAPEFPTDNFDTSKYTPSELNQRNFAMSLPTKLSDCDKFKKGVDGNKNDGKYNICYAKHKWLERFNRNSTIDCETYPRPSNGLNQSLTDSTPGKEQPLCLQIRNTLNRWGTDGTDKKPIREKEEREKKEKEEKRMQEEKIKYNEEKKEENRRYNIIESILEGRDLSDEDKAIFEKDFNTKIAAIFGISNYQNFLVNLKKEFDTKQPNNLKKEYEKYIAENNNDKFIIDNYDIKSTTSTKNSKGYYLLYAFKLFMHWLIKNNIEKYNKIGGDLIYYYNLSISKYYDDYNMDKDEIRKLIIYHKNPKKINQTIYNLVDDNTVLQNPSLKFYKKQLLFKPDPSNECVTNIENPTCKFNSFLDSYNLKKSTNSTIPFGGTIQQHLSRNLNLSNSISDSNKNRLKKQDIMLKILRGIQLTKEEDKIFEEEHYNNTNRLQPYSYFIFHLVMQWIPTSRDKLYNNYKEYIKNYPNNNERIIDIENTEYYRVHHITHDKTKDKQITPIKNSKGYYIIRAFKLFMLWMIENHYKTMYTNINKYIPEYYNLAISMYHQNDKGFKEHDQFLREYHSDSSIRNSDSPSDNLNPNYSIFLPSFYKEEYLIRSSPQGVSKCLDLGIKNPGVKRIFCEFQKSLNTYKLIKEEPTLGPVVESGVLPYIQMPAGKNPSNTFYVGGNDKKYTNKIYNSQKSKYKVCTYITDVEGNMDFFNKYVNISKVIEWTSEKKNRLKFRNDDSIFIYGGDTQDRGDSDIRFVNILLKFKEDYPERVIFIIGNRDANKLRIPSELSEKYSNYQNFLKKYDNYPYWEDKSVRITLRKYLKDNNYELNVKNRLKYIVERTMDNNDGFEKRRNELSIILKKNINNISDNDVISSFLNSVLPKPKNITQSNDNYMLKYLMQGQLIYIFGEHIFVHGAINEKNIGKIPKNKNTIEDIHIWAKELNDWFHKELKEYMNNTKDGGITKKRKAHNIIDYVVPGDNNDISVVYANNLKNGNGAHINKNVIEHLNKYGIKNIITGHKPHGDCPLVIRDKNLTAVSADTSYSNINYLKNIKGIKDVKYYNDKRGKAVSEVLLYSNGDIRVHGILADNSKYGYIIKKYKKSPSSSTSYIGLQLNNKYWVKNVKKDKYLISYGKGFDIDEKWINIEELKKLLKKP
jgi:hypothetical protein